MKSGGQNGSLGKKNGSNFRCQRHKTHADKGRYGRYFITTTDEKYSLLSSFNYVILIVLACNK